MTMSATRPLIPNLVVRSTRACLRIGEVDILGVYFHLPFFTFFTFWPSCSPVVGFRGILMCYQNFKGTKGVTMTSKLGKK